MKNNRFIVGLIIAIAAMGLIVFLHQQTSGPVADDEIGKLVFPDLKAKLNEINEVKLASNDKTTTIDRKGNDWKIEEKAGYSADFAKLSAFLDGMAKATYLERKTSKPGNFPVLGLSSIDDSSSKAVDVTVSTRDGAQYELLVGNDANGESGRFVRKPAESQAWLVDHIDKVPSDPVKWIEPVIMSVNADQVTSIIDRSGDGKHVLSIKRDKDSGDLTIQNLPKGAQLNYTTIGNAPAEALTNIRATDVRARGEKPWKGAATASYEFKDGSSLVVHAMQDSNGKDWLRFDLDLSKKPSEDISYINVSRLRDFEFEVADYTYNQFTLKLSDMIRKQEKKNPAG